MYSSTFLAACILLAHNQLSYVGGQTIRNQILVAAVRNVGGEFVCAADGDGTTSLSESEGQCTVQCLHDQKCLCFNFKNVTIEQKLQPVCELFRDKPCNFSVVANCKHFQKQPPQVCPANCQDCCSINEFPIACKTGSCLPGYANNNNGTCSEIDECVSQPCQHGATCNNLINRFTCACALGYAGVLCETDINECSSGPCVNGATCVNNIGYYACTCRAGYLGTNCQTDMVCYASPARYDMVVYTGGDPTAGTNANVYAQLYGTAGGGTEHYLDNPGDDFQPGAGDSFTVFDSYALNRLTLLHVRMDDTGVSPAWNIDRVVVYDVSCGGVYTFYGNGVWLGGGYGLDTYLYP